MAEPTLLSPTPALLAPRGRQLLRSVSTASDPSSPTRQRHTDDLLSNLNPRTAVEALRDPSGTLKACMNSATSAEQAFALRAAVASANILEWLEELDSWPWPLGGGSAGFENPASDGPVLFSRDARAATGPDEDRVWGGTIDKSYIGSIPAAHLARYERRMDEIAQGMEELDVEEIKSQVLHNHIMPLSRPGTPIMGMDRAVSSSLSSIVMMDDMTAIVTATIVQALPNLSKLTRLMNAWSLRLLVLRKVPAFWTSIADAEVALRSGWNAIGLGARTDRGATDQAGADGAGTGAEPLSLSRKEFNVMKSVLQKKVLRAGRDLDAMLDVLEGSEDTLPDAWLDRVEMLEKDYAQWAVVCERKVQESEWARMKREEAEAAAAEAEAAEVVSAPVDVDRTEEPEGHKVDSVANADRVPAANENGVATREVGGTENGAVLPTGMRDEDPDPAPPVPPQPDENPTQDAARSRSAQSTPVTKPLIKVHVPDGESNESAFEESPTEFVQANLVKKKALQPSVDGSADDSDTSPAPLDGAVASVVTHREPQKHGEKTNVLGLMGEGQERAQDSGDDVLRRESFADSDYDFDFGICPDRYTPEPELPTLPRPRSTSDASLSTIANEPRSGFLDFSSDQLQHGTPERPRRATDLPDSPRGFSPSPPDFRSSIRSVSVSFNDMPTVAEVPSGENSPKTPRNLAPETSVLGSSMLDMSVLDTSSLDASTLGSSLTETSTIDSGISTKESSTSSDDQLQWQISEILESVPAKIRLKAAPPPIDLNPPDFAMRVTRKTSRPDLAMRSQSSLSTVSNSSRAGTPSFTLAPAYARNARPRHQHGNQEIKLYHLSRSNGEVPIKLFIRCVGEQGERVMVRVGGGWADLGEYLKEYALHHGRRSGGEGKVEVKDLPRVAPTGRGSTPTSRPASAQDAHHSSPLAPLNVRKTRRNGGEEQPRTPLATVSKPEAGEGGGAPSSGESTRSRSSSRVSWDEEDSSLGMAGPKAKQIEMSEERKAWVESVKEKVRIASGERKVSETGSVAGLLDGQSSLGEMGKVGSTKRLFRRHG